ncbi:hypothetical protein L195_g005050 [Trifolium pratense]|uniref:Uncharacterized protein n=1 Tax=Trifolium pratense TaxID=57577 RepID=A0A2K3NZV1_TRIPR|nr:hypothetical protein L195_g005050 [Trifolium pratense]
MFNEFVRVCSLRTFDTIIKTYSPIAVDTILRRLISNVAMKGVGKYVAKYLNDFQFGVGISGGAEAILHSANRLLSQ